MFYDENHVVSSLEKYLAKNAKFAFAPGQIVSITKDFALNAAYVLGANKSMDSTYVLEIKSVDAETFGKDLFHFGVKYNPGESENDPGNFSILLGFGKYEGGKDEKIIRQDVTTSQYIDRLVAHNIKQNSFSLEPMYLKMIVAYTFEFYAEYLNESKSDVTTDITIPGMMVMSISPEGVLSAVAESEVKKRIKSDEMLGEVK